MVIIALSLIQIYILYRSQLLQYAYLYVSWLQDGIIKKIIIIITIGKRDQKKSTMIFFSSYDHISVITLKWSTFLSLLPILTVSVMLHFKAIVENWKKERNTKPSLLNQQMELWKMGKFDKNLKSWILPSIIFNIFIINEK